MDHETPERTLQDLVDALSLELERPVLLDDAALRPVAYSRQWGAVDRVRTDSILSRGASRDVRRTLFEQGIARARGAVRTRRVPELGMDERLCVPARHAGTVRGYLWLLDDDARLDADGVARAEAAAARAAKLLAAQEPARSPLYDHGALLARLRSARAEDQARAIAEIRTRELLPDGRSVAVLIGSRKDGPRSRSVLTVLGSRLSAGNAVAGTAPEGVALLLSLADHALSTPRVGEIASSLLRDLGDEAAVGQSGITRDLDTVPWAWGQAAVALRVARAKPPAEAYAAWDALGADRLVARLNGKALTDLPPGLSRLLEHEPVLAQTLEAFLEAAGDVPATATALNLHRSGVYYRLRRASELTGLDLRRGEDRLLAHIALRLARLD